MLRRLAVISLFLLAGPAFAQNVVIRAGHIVDPATGTVKHDQYIFVANGKIADIAADPAITGPSEVIDLSKAWVMPGLMDAHTHLTMNLPPAAPGQSLWEHALLTESSGMRLLRGIRNARLLLEAGFTTVRDVGNAANFSDSDLRRAIELGWFPGPTVLNSGKIIAPFGGQSRDFSPEMGPFWQFEYLDADTPDEIRRAVRRNIYYGATMIKLAADNSAFHYSQDEIRAAVTEAHAAGLTVAVHVYGGEAARNVILGGADSVEHGFDLNDELLRLMKEKGTFLVGTDFPYEHMVAFGGMVSLDPRQTFNKIQDRLRRAYKIGVKMAFGSDTVVDFPGRTRAEMMLDYLDVWLAAGVPPAEILKAMTTNAAELFHLKGVRGAIAKGEAADIIATPESPLEDIRTLRRVQFVMKNGKVVKEKK